MSSAAAERENRALEAASDSLVGMHLTLVAIFTNVNLWWFLEVVKIYRHSVLDRFYVVANL
jgi:hypothetical protein